MRACSTCSVTIKSILPRPTPSARLESLVRSRRPARDRLGLGVWQISTYHPSIAPGPAAMPRVTRTRKSPKATALGCAPKARAVETWWSDLQFMSRRHGATVSHSLSRPGGRCSDGVAVYAQALWPAGRPSQAVSSSCPGVTAWISPSVPTGLRASWAAPEGTAAGS